MTIWVFNKPECEDFVFGSLKKGIARFGWSMIENADLKRLKEMTWNEMSEVQREIWKKANFLLNIRKNDWIVYVNIPEWGEVTAAKVNEEYNFEPDVNKYGVDCNDFRHYLKIDLNSLITFDRNDFRVHPVVSRKLKLRGRYWRLYAEKEFLETIKLLKSDVSIDKLKDKEVYYLVKELNESEIYDQITQLIHKTHPEKKLEVLIKKIFENLPDVISVEHTGVGWGTDHGADLIITYKSGLKILDLESTEKVVVQIKSYEGEHKSIEAVEQIKTAINKFDAKFGIIITTGQPTKELEEKVEQVNKEMGKDIRLIAGDDVAKFILKYGSDLIIDI